MRPADFRIRILLACLAAGLLLCPLFAQSAKRGTKSPVQSTRTPKPRQDEEAKPSAPVTGESRVALIIGNSKYAESPLKNPANDARAMARALREFGFHVTELEDANQQRMDEAIRAFRTKLSEGRGTGLFFFAGHGVAIGGKNYLIPVGQTFESESDVKYKAIDAGFVLAAMEDAGARVSLLILDACRNNPFGARSLFRSEAKGLATMDAPKGSLVAFATAPGSTAADGSGANGLYTGEFIRAIHEMPNLEVEQLMKKVSARVQTASGGSQVPYRSSSLTGEFFFRPGAVAPASAAPGPAQAPAALVMTGNLQVNVNAQDAQVYVDGAPKGKASPSEALNLKDLPVGEVQVKVEAPGYEASTQPFTIEPGQWTQASLILKKLQAQAPASGASSRINARMDAFNRARLAKLNQPAADPNGGLSGVKIRILYTPQRTSDAQRAREILKQAGADVELTSTTPGGNSPFVGKVFWQQGFEAQAQNVKGLLASMEALTPAYSEPWAGSPGLSLCVWIVR